MGSKDSVKRWVKDDGRGNEVTTDWREEESSAQITGGGGRERVEECGRRGRRRGKILI
jgi:hypothetical protein